MTFVSVEFVEVVWKLTVSNRSVESDNSLNQQKSKRPVFLAGAFLMAFSSDRSLCHYTFALLNARVALIGH